MAKRSSKMKQKKILETEKPEEESSESEPEEAEEAGLESTTEAKGLEEEAKIEVDPGDDEPDLESETQGEEQEDLDEIDEKEPEGEYEEELEEDSEEVEEIEETGEKPEKLTIGQKLHRINVRLPWLKIVLLVLLAGSAAVGMEEFLRHSVKPAVVTTTGVENDMAEIGELKAEQLEGEVREDLAEVAKPVEVDMSVVPIPYEVPDYTGKKLIALTFDDGPSSITTSRLLDILRERGVKATFFVLGNMAQRSPELLKREVAEGHEVGSHTMTHRNLARATVQEISWENEQMNNIFVQILGVAPGIMRPPYGAITDTVRSTVAQPMVIWTIDPEDWKYKDAVAVRSKVVNAAFDGAIILVHDIHASTIDAIPGIIDDLRAQGYEFLTVSDLAKVRGVTLERGWTYGSFRP